MTVQEFINKWNGKFVDYDGNFGNQCVDLMRQYLTEVINIQGYSLKGVSYAKQLFTTMNVLGDENFIKIANGKSNYPQRGDIIVWGWRYPVTGYAGHVAICSDANINRFISFDQNYPIGYACRYVNHDYRGVLGWLRPRKGVK